MLMRVIKRTYEVLITNLPFLLCPLSRQAIALFQYHAILLSKVDV